MSESFGPEHLRIGDQQREEAISALNDHFAAGRLDIVEYENRVTRASAAQAHYELGALFSDLPQPHPPFLVPPSVPFQTMSFGPPPFQPPPAYQQPPPGYGYPPPYGYDPYGQPMSDKSKVIAGVLQLLVGGFGVGRFYTGHYGIAIAQLFTCGGCGIWALVDGILLLVNGGTDAEGRRLRD